MASACSGAASKRSSIPPASRPSRRRVRPSQPDAALCSSGKGDRTMSDVRETDAPATSRAEGPNPTGDFIWYELMTTDAEGAKAFYDPLIGWDIGKEAPEFNGYRTIGRSDGGFAGGV